MRIFLFEMERKIKWVKTHFFILFFKKETRIEVVRNVRMRACIIIRARKKEKILKILLTLLARYSIFLEVDAYICRHIDV